jgi:non-ribosomal peptide synthetase component F
VGAVVVIPQSVVLSPEAFVGALWKQKITTMFLTSSL